jgi:hypothetical protein
VTSLVTGDGTYNLVLVPTSNDNLSVNSRNAATNRPELVVSYDDGTGGGGGGTLDGADLGPNASLNGARLFPDDNAWNRVVTGDGVDPNSATLIANCGPRTALHPDFGTEWDGHPIGIPYVVVGAAQPDVPVTYTAYGSESDPGPFPIPPGAPIEAPPDGDRHVLVIDKDAGRLVELYRAFPAGAGWEAESGATWDTASNALRPDGWTSADAAGLPVFPGLVRYDEAVELGEIRHALRFTCSTTRRGHIAPARHSASSLTGAQYPPMGMRVRLRADFDISGFSPETQVILTALKTYGMILADNGSSWFVSGSPDPRWDDDALGELHDVPRSAFDVLTMGPVTVP